MKHPITILILFVIAFQVSCKKKNNVPPANPPESGVKKIFFSSNATGNYEIWAKDQDMIYQITNDPAYESWWPRLSPDGSTLLFYRSPAPGKDNDYDNAELCSIHPDATNFKVLIPKDSYSWNQQGVADWSPDGSKLVMAAQSSDDNRWNIYITDSLGKNPDRVSQRTGFYLDPSFSPDGKKIVCAAFPADYAGVDVSRLEIFTMNTDGSDEQRLTNDTLRDHDPYWSWDGTEIAFETAVDPGYLLVGKWAIRAVKPDGSGLREVINDGNINTLPRWSFDSKQIYFHRLVFGGARFHIVRVNRDGTGLADVTSGKSFEDIDADPVR